MSIRLRPAAETLRRLAGVALGTAEADLVLTGGALVNVFTEELQDGWGLALADGRVAFVGPDADVSARAGDTTERIELGGDLVAPGLIEGHTHLTRIDLADMADLQLAAGVTTTVVEIMELAVAVGLDGVRALLDAAEGTAGRLLFVASGLIVCDPEHDARLEAHDWPALLDHARIAGLGEVYWGDLLRGHRRSETMIDAALERGLPVEGHAAGARAPTLNALAGYGIRADHESITPDDVLARRRLGLHTELRHGATRQDLPAMAPFLREGRLDGGGLSFVTDGLEPDAAARGDSLNWIVEQAVELGVPLPRAIRMASHSAAERLGLGRWLGGLGPGMLADLVVLSRGRGFRPRLVLVGGRRPEPSARPEYPAWMLDTVRLNGLRPDVLTHPGPGRWRAMRQVAPIVTREVESDGSEAIVCAVVDRLGGSRGFRGLWEGFGLRGGGVAITSAWESSGIVIVGDRPDDMAIAARRVQDLRGGAAVVADGLVLAEWAAPVAGLYSSAPHARVVDEVGGVNRALAGLGCPWPNPVLALETLTTAAIPFLRIWSGGYYRLRDGARPGLSADDGRVAAV
ncbi:MAG TPA: adenine deaminase C-terminal domain-containing protein [Candidatus Dormibacteraeota bacterium]|nr:adenine deaminase C-terminal domain-containing protein [Candidatus Dormibacteraeota bacterium]